MAAPWGRPRPGNWPGTVATCCWWSSSNPATSTAPATATPASSGWPTATPGTRRWPSTALRWWRLLEDEAGESLLDLCGQIDHGAGAALDDIAAALGGHRRPFERLSPAEAAERWPGIRTEGGVVRSPDGGYVAADRSVAALYRVAGERGATVRTDTACDASSPTTRGPR